MKNGEYNYSPQPDLEDDEYDNLPAPRHAKYDDYDGTELPTESIIGEGGYSDAWGDPYVSPSKMLGELKNSPKNRSTTDDDTAHDDEYHSSTSFSKQQQKEHAEQARAIAWGTLGGPIFNTIISISSLILYPFGVKNLALIRTAFSSVYAIMQIMLFGICCVFNPFDNWGSKWGSINLFTGAIRLPAMDLATSFPFWLRPIVIKKMQFDSILALISFTKGIHIAINISNYNLGLIIEYKEKDPNYRKKVRPTSPKPVPTPRARDDNGDDDDDASIKTPTSAATQTARGIQIQIKEVLETLKSWGINVALSVDETCVALERVKIALDGTVTRSDDWWAQSTHFRWKDIHFTLSSNTHGGFISYEIMEIRLLEDDDDLYAVNEDYSSGSDNGDNSESDDDNTEQVPPHLMNNKSLIYDDDDDLAARITREEMNNYNINNYNNMRVTTNNGNSR